jgi:cobalt-zinc-cadmium efflux system membrane fusion protein
MEINKNILPALFMAVLSVSCSSGDHERSPEQGMRPVEGQVILTAAQEALADIHTAKLRKQLISDVIECNGTIEANPNEHALVSAPMKGYAKQIRVHVGDYVQRGKVLAILTHPDYIDLQQEFLETKSQYEYFREDFKRQGELSMEQAASIKTMQQAQNEFRKTEARLFALQQHLRFLGIDPDSLHVENMHTDIYLVSPVSGYVSDVNISLGMLCTEEIPVFQIIGNVHPLLHLKVFEKDAPYITPGQQIQFSMVSNPTQIFHASLKAATKSIDNTNTINLHADIENKHGQLMPGMFVKARILVRSDSVYAINSDAIIRSGDRSFIFEKTDSLIYMIHEITPGRSMNGATEIIALSENLRRSELVVQGAYYLNAELQKEE